MLPLNKKKLRVSKRKSQNKTQNECNHTEQKYKLKGDILSGVCITTVYIVSRSYGVKFNNLSDI